MSIINIKYNEKTIASSIFQEDKVFTLKCANKLMLSDLEIEFLKEDFDYEETLSGESVIGYKIIGKGTSNKTNLIIPNTYNEKPVEEIKEEAFAWDQDIKTVVLGENIKKIGEKAFYCCLKLRHLDLSMIDEIGQSAFESCRELEKISLTAGVEIEIDAFAHCDNLKVVEFNGTEQEWDLISSNFPNVTITYK